MPERTDSQNPARGLLRTLRRRGWIVAACAILAAVAAVAIAGLRGEEYEATSLVLVSNQARGDVTAAANQATSQVLTEVGSVEARTGDAVGISSGQVSSAISVSTSTVSSSAGTPGPASNVLTITATESSPRLSMRLANTYADEYVRFRRGLSGFKLGKATVLSRETTPSVSSSSKAVAGVVGLIVGIPLGLGLALLVGWLDPRVRDPEEAAAAVGAPLIGTVPRSRHLSGTAGPLREIPSQEMESLHLLRASVQHLTPDLTLRSLLLTSAAPEAGISTTALGLAAATGQAGHRVLLIDADLRGPGVSGLAGLDEEAAGLAAVLAGHAGLDEAARRIEMVPASGGSADPAAGFDLLPSGPAQAVPQPLIESSSMRELLDQAKTAYDLVLIDVPPIGTVSDGVGLLDQVDGLLVVARVDRDTREALQSLGERLHRLGAPLLGAIVSFAPVPSHAGYVGASRMGVRVSARPTSAGAASRGAITGAAERAQDPEPIT